MQHVLAESLRIGDTITSPVLPALRWPVTSVVVKSRSVLVSLEGHREPTRYDRRERLPIVNRDN